LISFHFKVCHFLEVLVVPFIFFRKESKRAHFFETPANNKRLSEHNFDHFTKKKNNLP